MQAGQGTIPALLNFDSWSSGEGFRFIDTC